MSQKTKAYIALGMVCFIWGTTYLAMRTGVKHTPGLMLAAMRQTACGIIVTGWFLAGRYPIPDRQTLLRLGIIGALMLGIGNGLMTWGEQTVPSGLAAILASLNPLCMALFSLLLMRGTKISLQTLTGLILGLAGIVIIFFPLAVKPMQNGFVFGTGIIALSVLGWSWGSVYAAKQNFTINIFYACGWEFLLGGIVLIIASVATGHTIPLASVSTESWLSLTYLVMIGSLIGFSAFQYALKHLPTTQVAIYAYINPLVALFLGWFILHEHLNWRIFIGSLITLAGVYLVQRSYSKVQRSFIQSLQHRKRWSSFKHGITGIYAKVK